MPIMHNPELTKIYRDGKLIAYDLKTVFPHSNMSSLIIVKDGLDTKDFYDSLNNHMESVDIRMIDLHNQIKKQHKRMIKEIISEQTIEERERLVDKSRDDFVNKYRQGSLFSKKLKDIGIKMLDELKDDELSSTILKDILNEINAKHQEPEEEIKKEPVPDYSSVTGTNNTVLYSNTDSTSNDNVKLNDNNDDDEFLD
jgi:hypothetical protein